MIHDLHAKYETAVNKAERVAQEAVKFTAESLSEQGYQIGLSDSDTRDIPDPKFKSTPVSLLALKKNDQETVETPIISGTTDCSSLHVRHGHVSQEN